MVTRTLVGTIKYFLQPSFIAVIYGPRRVGKTVLLTQLLEEFTPKNPLILNGDTQETQELLGTTSETKLSNLVANHDFIAIDEAQGVLNIALVLKIIIDKFPQKKLFVTGSTSLELARGVSEVLTGRTLKFRLYPFSTSELGQNLKNFEKPYLLENQLLFGGYPYLQQLSTPKEKIRYLDSLAKDYLFRDVLRLKDVAAPETLRKLTSLLAFQIGSEVSLNELATNLKIDVKTVDRYLSLLKLGFVIFELGAFAKNLRKEIRKSKKYYFWDLGIRNSLIGQFMPLSARTDTGQLWENFLAVERLKKLEYEGSTARTYFWRTYDGAEVDWIEIENSKISAFEFKWQSQKPHTPKVFKETYQTEVRLITKENYLEFLGA